MVVVVLIFMVAIPVWLIVSLKQLKKMKADLQEATTLAHGVTDADEYEKSKHTEADNYSSSKKEDADKEYSNRQNEIKNLEKSIHSLEMEKANLKSELSTLDLDVAANMVRIDAYAGMKSDEVKNQLSLLGLKQDEMVKGGSALSLSNISSTKKVADSQKKQILRCFNAETSNIIESVTVKNADSSRAKIQRSFEAINKIFAIDGVQISQPYLASKFEELSLVYAYMVKQGEEAEQRKAIREQMVEEEKVRREIEREKQRIEKEESQFSNEVKKLMSYMQNSKDDVERQLYIDKIQELEEKLKGLAADKENVLEREENTRAGFVYIISNIGSFGEDVYKIGMTRRLDPMDRIAELSSASVPFVFDVHAMIFSSDAPALETILHQHFDKMRVNKVNERKEFFKVDLDEIKKVVLENHNATVRFVDVPDAVEYRETFKLEQQEQVG